jgi:hypothetical protein
VSDEVFQQLARDAFLRTYARPVITGNAVDSNWIGAYVTALRDVMSYPEGQQAPGLVAMLIEMVDEQRRVIEGLKAGSEGSAYVP